MFENSDLPPRSVESKVASRPAPRAHRLPILALSIILLAGLSGCQTPYESGLSEFKSGQFQVAEQHAKRGLDEDPEDPELNLLLARTLVAQKNYRDAEAYAEVAFRSGKLPAESGRILGKIQWELGRAMDAADSWKSARAARPDSVNDVDYLRALESALRMASSIQNYARALHFRLALAEVAPEHAEATPALLRQNREQLAAQWSRMGKFEQSIEEYETLLEAHPDHEAYVEQLAQLHEKLGRTDEARTYYDRYIQGAPDGDPTYRTITISQTATSPELVQHYMEQAFGALQGAPSHERALLSLRLAAAGFERNDDAEAKRYVEQYLSDMEALNDNQVNIEIYFNASSVASRYQRPKYALELLERGQAMAPSNWQLTEQLAGLYTRRAMRADVERVLNEFVDGSEEPFDAQVLVARWAHARRNYDLAQHFMERALEERGDIDSRTWLELARIYTAQGRTDRLKVAVTNYLKPKDRTASELVMAARIYTDARLFKEAEDVLKRAQKLDPKDINTLDELAALYADWGKPESIEPYYDRWIAANGKRAEDYTLIGSRFLSRSNENQAIPYFRKGAAAGDVDAWLRLATLFRQQRRYIDMREALQGHIDSAEDPDYALRNAQSYYQMANLTSDEIAVLETLIARNKDRDSIEDHWRLSELYLQQGREDDATATWAAYLSAGANPRARLSDAAQRLARNSDPAWVLSVYTKLLDAENPDPILYKLAGDTHLEIANRGRYRRDGASQGPAPDAIRRAQHYYRLYLDKASPSRTVLLDFATTMTRKEQWATAADTYKLLLDGQPDNAALWLNYGEVLLKVGRSEEGIRLLKRYASQRPDSLTDARKVADALVGAQLYQEAEPYFDQLFESESLAKHLHTYAFRRLAETYLVTRRAEQIPALAQRYLKRSQNPTEARQEILNILKNAGMYAQAAAQIERIRSYQGNVLGRELAENWFRAGEFDKAYNAFKEDAESDAYPGDAWVAVAQFYAASARPERAEEAFNSALKAAPESASAHMNYALFLFRQGEVERGRERLNSARAHAADGQREEFEFDAATTLAEIGRFDLSAEIARGALERGTHGRKDEFTFLLTRYQLATQAPALAQRTVDALKKSGLPLRQRVKLLTDNGFGAQALQWIEEAIGQSNYYIASQLLLGDTTKVTAMGGFERLESALKPLLERQDESANANAGLGYAMLRQGQYARAIPYLKAAEASGFPQGASLLADAYGGLGLEDRAFKHYRRLLANTPDEDVPHTLQRIGGHLDRVGQGEAFIRLLRALTTDRKYEAVAMPILAKSLIHAGQIEQAFDLVYAIIPAPNEAEAPAPRLAFNANHDADITTLIGVLRALAEAGYVAEARATLARATARLPEDTLKDHRLREFSLQLYTTAPADKEALSRLLDEGADAPSEDATSALYRARVLMINGHFEAADAVAKQAFANATADSQKQLGDFLLGNVLAAGQVERIDETVKLVIDTSGNKLEATKQVISRLNALGQDARALRLALEIAREQPTAPHLQRALALAQAAGDLDAVASITARLVRVDSDATRTLKRAVTDYHYQQKPALSRAVFEPVRRSAPATIETRFFNILSDFRAANMEAGRAGIRDFIEAVNFDPYAVELLLERLDEQHLFVESARVVAPLLKGRALSTQSHQFIGIALRQIGDIAASKASFANYIKLRPEPARAGYEVASLLLQADYTEDARDYAQQAIDAEPTFLPPYFVRAAARIEAGELDGARADLAKSLGTGVDRYYGLYNAAYHALKAGHEEFATPYLMELMNSPMITLNYSGVQLALMAFIEADRAEQGVAFLEKNHPQIAGGTGNLGETLITMASNVYSAAGQTERAHQLYEAGITRQLAADPLSDRTITYMNNLAYGYATDEAKDPAKIAKGFDLVQRAIAASPSRSTSFLDTIGWLHFRQNDLDLAEGYIRGALATSPATPDTLGELIDHIIAIESARGAADEASWLQVHRDTLR
ncbi:tetratricopeptide repeat protein [Bradymonas sediminis]|uniref:Uncharacterized protein n=1 Tax=Bradymonas sediminis TaxID=1548548 RepID=A0A2Z4FK87_9DELT|nr:hypothetical protein DN745_08580 [Bradymonas sediminis]TDP73568.1 tetratricopeptide repeat protein [Bradymonas sediminis]